MQPGQNHNNVKLKFFLADKK